MEPFRLKPPERFKQEHRRKDSIFIGTILTMSTEFPGKIPFIPLSGEVRNEYVEIMVQATITNLWNPFKIIRFLEGMKGILAKSNTEKTL
ncbi:MAG: hypothetical protein K9I68_06520 [Bacteroidales bacterium]|nr:hypothetical protein [Bacteroidales bacterium]